MVNCEFISSFNEVFDLCDLRNGWLNIAWKFRRRALRLHFWVLVKNLSKVKQRCAKDGGEVSVSGYVVVGSCSARYA